MKLTSFLHKNKIKLSSSALKMCMKAETILKNSVDPIHDIGHVENMLGHLNYLLRRSRNIRHKIDIEVILLSLFWHDIWASKQKVKGFFDLIMFQFVEGLKSARIFWTIAISEQIDRIKANNVYYAIRKHSSFQIFPPRTLEAKILVDLDKIELWNNIRYIKDKSAYVAGHAFFQKYLVRFYYFYSFKMGLNLKTLNRRFNSYARRFWKQNGLL